MVLALSLLLFLYPVFAGVVLIQMADQRNRDKSRLSYIVTFPNDLTNDSIVALIWAISGRTQGGSWFEGVHTIAFEVWVPGGVITHRRKVPWQQADSVIPQLQGLIPGIRVTPDYDPPRMTWTRAVELGLTNPGRPLRIDSAERVSTSLLKSIDHLDAGETVMMQLIVTPAS